MKLHGTPTLEPGRKVYVLLSADESHVASLPDGTADWSYNLADMELRRLILVKDFKNKSFTVTTLVEALIRIANKQSELEKNWTSALNEIKKTKDINNAFIVYAKAKKAFGAHPLSADSFLRKKFHI